MSERDCLLSFSKNLFWDVDPSELSMEVSARYIIQRVLEYGQMNDWRLINRYYGLDISFFKGYCCHEGECCNGQRNQERLC